MASSEFRHSSPLSLLILFRRGKSEAHVGFFSCKTAAHATTAVWVVTALAAVSPIREALLRRRIAADAVEHRIVCGRSQGLDCDAAERNGSAARTTHIGRHWLTVECRKLKSERASKDVAAVGVLKCHDRLNGSHAYILSWEQLMVDRGGCVGAGKEQSLEGYSNLIGVADRRPGTEIVTELHYETGRHEWVL